MESCEKANYFINIPINEIELPTIFKELRNSCSSGIDGNSINIVIAQKQCFTMMRPSFTIESTIQYELLSDVEEVTEKNNN